MTTTQPTSISPLILNKMNSFLCEQEFTHFVTLSFNDYQTGDVARIKLKEFHARIDRELLGSKWYKKPKEKRTFFFGFPEHIDGNFHYHLLMRFKEQSLNELGLILDRQWRGLVPMGTTKTLEIYSEKSVIEYCQKEQYKTRNYESFIVSDVFLSN